MCIDHEAVLNEAHKRAVQTQYISGDYDRQGYLGLVAQFSEDIIEEIQEGWDE